MYGEVRGENRTLSAAIDEVRVQGTCLGQSLEVLVWAWEEI